jgi:hypothetical protein
MDLIVALPQRDLLLWCELRIELQLEPAFARFCREHYVAPCILCLSLDSDVAPRD